MTDSKFLDSSIWIDYFVNGEHKELIETKEKLFLATISIIEIRNKLNKLKIPLHEISEKINFVKKLSFLVSLDEDVAERASEFVMDKKMPVADAIIYASAIINKSTLITLDNDFRNLPNTQIL